MEKPRTFDSENSQTAFLHSPEAVEAVARSLYGEDEYDALSHDNQVKNAYRKRAYALLKLAIDAGLNSESKRKLG